VADLLESPFETAGIVNTNDAAEEEVGDKAHAYRDEETHPEPDHSVVDNPFSKDRIRIKESGDDKHKDRIPEVLDLVCVYIVILVFIVLKLQKAEFIEQEYQGTDNNEAGAYKKHVLIPVGEYLGKRVSGLHG
jgi:hypothetical protein